jgi:predicted TIM-barrel enzyme
VTGKGTGYETPLGKIKEFRRFLGDFPLIIGAGVNESNFAEQLSIADACIIGSYFKNGNTRDLIIKEKVKKLIDIRDNNF